jgi:hypothetical protein
MMNIYKNYSMKIIACVLLLHVSLLSFAQDGQALRKIEAARIALITERLDLTPQQAEKFWPLYNEYTSKREDLRREFLRARREARQNESASEEESKELLKKGMELKEKQLNLDKIYAEKFTTVITATQVLQLRKAEEDFRQMLLERIEKRREHRDRINSRDSEKDE